MSAEISEHSLVSLSLCYKDMTYGDTDQGGFASSQDQDSSHSGPPGFSYLSFPPAAASVQVIYADGSTKLTRVVLPGYSIFLGGMVTFVQSLLR